MSPMSLAATPTTRYRKTSFGEIQPVSIGVGGRYKGTQGGAHGAAVIRDRHHRRLALRRQVRAEELVGDLAGKAIDRIPVPTVPVGRVDRPGDSPFGEI